MTITLDKGREVYEHVRAKAVRSFEQYRRRDLATKQRVAFLLRGINAADAARVLVEQGYELEARGCCRILVEAYVELSFITCDPTLEGKRMTLFFGHAAYGHAKEARGIADLHAMSPTDPHLLKVEAAWDAVKGRYSTRQPWNWCQEFPSLRQRALEAGRVLDDRAEKETGTKDTVWTRHFERTYELVYAEGCMTAHVSPGSFYEFGSTIGPAKPTDGRTLSWAAWMLATLLDKTREAVGDLSDSTIEESVDIVAPNAP